MTTEISIDHLPLTLFLGWDETERQTPQTVHLSLRIKPHIAPKALTSDLLHDTICYQSIETSLIQHFQHHTFRLIEHLAYCCQQKVLALLPEKTSLSLTVTKDLGPTRGTRSFTLTTEAD